MSLTDLEIGFFSLNHANRGLSVDNNCFYFYPSFGATSLNILLCGRGTRSVYITCINLLILKVVFVILYCFAIIFLLSQ